MYDVSDRATPGPDLEFYNPTDQVIKLDQYGFPNSNNGDADGNPNTPDYWNAFKKGATSC